LPVTAPACEQTNNKQISRPHALLIESHDAAIEHALNVAK
jgi:hypothetical protein